MSGLFLLHFDGCSSNNTNCKANLVAGCRSLSRCVWQWMWTSSASKLFCTIRNEFLWRILPLFQHFCKSLRGAHTWFRDGIWRWTCPPWRTKNGTSNKLYIQLPTVVVSHDVMTHGQSLPRCRVAGRHKWNPTQSIPKFTIAGRYHLTPQSATLF